MHCSTQLGGYHQKSVVGGNNISDNIKEYNNVPEAAEERRKYVGVKCTAAGFRVHYTKGHGLSSLSFLDLCLKGDTYCDC